MTIRNALTWAALCVAMLAGPVAAQVQPREVKTIRQPQFDIDYQLGDTKASQVELWYTDDKSATWKLYGVDTDRQSPVSFTAPHEGVYGFTVIARNKAGASAPDPVANTEPMFWCFVDWHRPQVQITGPTPTVALDGSGAGQVVLKPGEPMIVTYAAVDENLVDKPIRIEYRLVNDTTWKDVAVNQPNTGRYLWNVPEAVTGPFLLRVTAIDQAGNVGPASTLREMEIVRRAEPLRVAEDWKGRVEPKTGGDTSTTRLPTRPIDEPRTSMPDWPELPPLGPAVGLGQPALPPVSPKGITPGPMATPRPTDPPPVVDPRAVTPGGDVIAPPMIVTDQDALGMFVLQYTAPEPQPTGKMEPVVAKLNGALKPLVDRGMIGLPIGIAMQPVPDSMDLVKVVRAYALIPPSNRKPEQVAVMEQLVQQQLGAMNGSVMTRFEKAPTPAAAQPIGPAVATGPKAPPPPSMKDETLTPVDPTVAATGGTVPVGPASTDPASAKPQAKPDDPATAAAGRQEVVLQFGRNQPDLKIDPPPPAPPVPVTPAIVSAPKGDTPSPVRDSGHAPAPDGKISSADLPGRTPGSPIATDPTTTPPAVATGPVAKVDPGPAAPTTVTKIGSGDPTVGPPPVAPVGTNPLTPGVTIRPDAPPTGARTTPPPPVAGGTATNPVTPPALPTADSAKMAAAQIAFKNGQTAYSLGDRTKAETCFREALSNDPEMVDALINLAGIQMLNKDYPAAEVNYQKAVLLDGNQAKALFGLGSVQLLQKKVGPAQGTLEKLLRVDSNNAAAWLLYGDASLSVRENAKAVAAWKEAARLSPSTNIGKTAQDRLVRYGTLSN